MRLLALVVMFGAAMPAAVSADQEGGSPRRFTIRTAVRDAVARTAGAAEGRRSAVRLASVQPKAPDSTRNGVLIGAFVGLGYGLAVDALISGELGVEQKIMIPVTTAATGAGIGWIIDKIR